MTFSLHACRLLSAYHLDLLLAECSCKVRPSPCATAFGGFLLLTQPLHDFLHWCRQGMQESYGRPSWTHCTQSETWPTWFDCTAGQFQTRHNEVQLRGSYTDISSALSDWYTTRCPQLSVSQIRTSSTVIQPNCRWAFRCVWLLKRS